MADQKISQLTSISTPDDADELPIVDDSASQTKRIRADNFRANYMVLGKLSVSTITSNKTLADSDNNGWIICDTDTAGGNITITVPDSMTAGVCVHFRLKGTGGNIVFSGSGGMSGNIVGNTTVSTENAVVALVIETSTSAAVTERS